MCQNIPKGGNETPEFVDCEDATCATSRKHVPDAPKKASPGQGSGQTYPTQSTPNTSSEVSGEAQS
ncbi:hypothetical protein BU17DRAFT_88744 [Hysterangium stoloniferum]|nr:hypothetical protein BU17DRAFT_103378 [Hysterangium stoloniferum]KAF8520578.1 hypothetical protein BU17DRAFT_88744 [Hysterangium stoloniferum]